MFAIVGIGIVDPLGADLHGNWERYLNGDVALSPINMSDYSAIKIKHAYTVNEHNLNLDDLLSNSERRHLDRYSILGLYAANQALKQTKLSCPENTAVIFSSLAGGALSTIECTKNLFAGKRSAPRSCLAAHRELLPSLVSKKFNFLGANLNITSACASGIITIDYATKLLDTYDQVVVGGCDVMVDPMDIYMFQCIGALDTRDSPISSPFDKKRNGFMMGEGAAVFVIKKVETAIKDGDTILAIVRGIGHGNDAFHETAMHENGIGGRRSIDMALKNAKIDLDDIRLVNAHATSTPNGDEIEYKILREYFPNADVMALKANIGHTMAACSLIELSYMIKSLMHQKIGPIANLTDPIGPGLTTQAKDINSNFALKNSFGFGGKSAAIILERA